MLHSRPANSQSPETEVRTRQHARPRCHCRKVQCPTARERPDQELRSTQLRLRPQSPPTPSPLFRSSSVTLPIADALLLRPLLEHLLHGFLYHFLVFVAVLVERVLGNSAPHERLLLTSYRLTTMVASTFSWGADSAHTATDTAHAPRIVGGLLTLATAGGEDQVRVLRFLTVRCQLLPAAHTVWVCGASCCMPA